MVYVIDANNLAGQMGILEEKNFNKILFEIVSEYFSEKESLVYLIFDSLDPMGDQEDKGNIKIVLAPRDNHLYNGADDKILEVIKNKLGDESFAEELTVVTNDNDLKDKIAEIAEDNGYERKLKILSCGQFLERIDKASEGVNDDFFAPEELSTEEQVEINEELKDLWQ